MEGAACLGIKQKHVWLNDGAGKFVDVAQAVGVTDTYDGRACALADLWNRGVLDVVVANQRGPLADLQEYRARRERVDRVRAARNQEQPQRDRRASHLFWNGKTQVQQVSGGSGFAAQNDGVCTSAWAKIRAVKNAVIRWPSGKIQTIDKPCAQQLYPIQGAGMSHRQRETFNGR
jgi:hypothetical protein